MTLRSGILLLVLAIGGAALAAGPPLVVSQDGGARFTGRDEVPIQEAIDAAVKQGGGEVLIRPGTYLIRRSLLLRQARQVALRGTDAEGVVLRLPPLAYAETAEAAPAGASELRVRRSQNLRAGMRLHLEAEGDLEPFTKKPRPYVLATVKGLAGDRIALAGPLAHPIPAGTAMRDADAPNLIEIREGSADILIEKLTLDGGRTAADPAVRGHAQLCGVFASGPYSYEKGPTGPRIEGVMVSRCIIQNCFGRGVAFYSVNQGFVLNTTIRDTADEAVDFDHFTQKSAMQACHVARCRVGVELNDASDCLVQHNEFRDCAIGLNLWRWCRQQDLNTRHAVRGNLFQDMAENAIQVAGGTSGSVFEGNEITGPGRNGIVLDGDGHRVAGNRIAGAKRQPIAVGGGKHTVEDNRLE